MSGKRDTFDLSFLIKIVGSMIVYTSDNYYSFFYYFLNFSQSASESGIHATHLKLLGKLHRASEYVCRLCD